MKKYLSFGLVFSILLLVGMVTGAHKTSALTLPSLIKSVTVNGGNSVTVKGSTSVNIAITTTLTIPFNWRSTSYSFDGSNFYCKNTPDHITSLIPYRPGGTYTESFSVPVPSSAGIYNLYIKTYGLDNSCWPTNGNNDSLTLNGAVIIDNTPPTLSEVAPIATLSSNKNPSYVFNSSEVGAVGYSGACGNGDISSAVAGDNTVVFNNLLDNTYSDCTITVTDAAGNSSSALHISAFAVDATPPVVTLNGDNPIKVEISTTDSFTDPGATAFDVHDGNLPVSPSGSVDRSTVGTYTITYSATDAAGNLGQATRIVNVVDEVAPVTYDNVPSGWQNSITTITITCTDDSGSCDKVYYTTNGDTPSVSSDYVNAGSGWQFTLSSNGQYPIQYFGVDAEGNQEAPHGFGILKIDTTAPTASVSSPVDSSLVHGTVDITADVSDTGGSDVAKVEFWNASVGTKIGEVSTAPYTMPWNTTSVSDGDHGVWVVAYDNAGNQTTSSTVNVTVDNTPPVITLLDSSPVNLMVLSNYTDAGATASDTHDGDLTPSIVVGGDTVLTHVPGTYVITYNVSDAAGNAATQVTRVVNVNTPGGGTPSSQGSSGSLPEGGSSSGGSTSGGGQVLGAETGPTGTEIAGCGERTTGYSSVTGESCENNIPHQEGQAQGQVQGAEKYVFTLTLKKGPPYHFSTWGNEVMELQKLLNSLGFGPLVVDGKYGVLTSGAVAKFQTAHGLVSDGTVGAATRDVLNSL